MAAALCKSIASTSRDLMATTSRFSPPGDLGSRSTIRLHSSPILPKPSGILDELLVRKFPPSLATQISERFLILANQLHATAQANLTAAVRSYPGLPGETMESTKASIEKMTQTMRRYYEEQLHQMMNLGVERAHQRLRELDLDNESTVLLRPSRRGRTFNQEYTPLLEKYFEKNPYPSAPDRILLARKSMMTPRQIEVWFQNHRNRARKEGKTIRRRSPEDLPSEIPMKPHNKIMPYFSIPPDERRESCETVSSEDESDDEGNAVISSLRFCPPSSNISKTIAPPHAFPTTYQEATTYATFIHRSDNFSCPPTAWIRTPSPPSKKRKMAVSLDELCSGFVGMLLSGRPLKKLKRNANKQPWYAHKQTVLLFAPHPALIRSLSRLNSITPPGLLPHLAPQAVQHPTFQSPAPDDPHITLVPSEIGAPPRKVARLPKRIPNHTSLAHRGIGLADTASSSRNSSFSSGGSSRRRLSTSSCSSTASSTLTTPVTVFTELPGMRAPSITSNLDDDGYQNLFGDLGRETSPPLQRQMSFSPGSRKLPFNHDFPSLHT